MVFVNLFTRLNTGNYNFFSNFLINRVGESCKTLENLPIVTTYLIYLLHLMGLEKMIFKDCTMHQYLKFLFIGRWRPKTYRYSISLYLKIKFNSFTTLFLLNGLRGLSVIRFFHSPTFGKFYEVTGNLVIISCYEII